MVNRKQLRKPMGNILVTPEHWFPLLPVRRLNIFVDYRLNGRNVQNRTKCHPRAFIQRSTSSRYINIHLFCFSISIPFYCVFLYYEFIIIAYFNRTFILTKYIFKAEKTKAYSTTVASHRQALSMVLHVNCIRRPPYYTYRIPSLLHVTIPRHRATVTVNVQCVYTVIPISVVIVI